MKDCDTIRRHIIDSAVSLFAKDPKNRSSEEDGVFTTAHYAQAMKAEFGGPVLNSVACAAHLEAMDDVTSAGICLWRCGWAKVAVKDCQDHEVRHPTTVRVTGEPMDKTPHESALCEAQSKVLELLAKPGLWWSVSSMAIAIKEEWSSLPTERDSLLHDLVGCVLYTMAVEGKVVTKKNMFQQIFALAPESVDTGSQPQAEG